MVENSLRLAGEPLWASVYTTPSFEEVDSDFSLDAQAGRARTPQLRFGCDAAHSELEMSYKSSSVLVQYTPYEVH